MRLIPPETVERHLYGTLLPEYGQQCFLWYINDILPMTAMSIVEEQHRSNSFVLRIWWEGGTRPHEWRGWVQHAVTGETHYFCRLAELLAFVEAHTGPLAQTLGAEVDGPRRGGDDE